MCSSDLVDVLRVDVLRWFSVLMFYGGSTYVSLHCMLMPCATTDIGGRSLSGTCFYFFSG